MQLPIAILLLKNQLAAWKLMPPTPPRRLKIQGETTLPISSREALVAAFTDLIDNLRGDGIDPSEVHWLIDQDSRLVWRESLALLEKTEPSGAAPLAISQSLSCEWLASRFGAKTAQILEDPVFMESQALPWLVTADNAAERQQMQEALVREHQGESGRLAAERIYLHQENERLRAQNIALQQVDAERLLRFLPALFPRVFTVLGAADLALLCGRVEPLAIPNPYPEPSEETLRTLQKNFRALPRELQAQIVRFVERLPQRQKLVPRTEMRELVNELEEN
jgi:hypothetical protein